jgi:hypothetical protein
MHGISNVKYTLQLFYIRRIANVRRHIPHLLTIHFSFIFIYSHFMTPDENLGNNKNVSCTVVKEGLVFILLLWRSVEPRYNDIGLCDTSPIASHILWYQLNPHCKP